MDIIIPAAALPIKESIIGLYKLAEGNVKKRFKTYSNDRNIKKIYEHLRDIGKVRTVWQTERPVAIKNFYYPQKVKFENVKHTVNNIDDLVRISNRVVVQGIVGQGKSIFLRYLCVAEIKNLNSIPVFLELRKFRKNKSIVDQVGDFLDEIGFDSSFETFDFLARNKKIRLILDAFDELTEDIEGKVLKEIESLCRKYPNLNIIISSRPDCSIQNSEFFTVTNIAPLQKEDLPPLLNKLCQSKNVAQEIYDGICKSGSVVDVLSTPLMVTLLVFVYKSDHKIPARPVEFYESLFITVLSRHDKLKPGGVNRNKKTILSDSSCQKVFNCISFLSSQESAGTMKEREIISYIDRAKKYVTESFSSEYYLSDVCKITCLILKDGFDYNFLHKSIQEYHSAKFLASIPEIKSVSFYGKIIKDGAWKKWSGQLDFLAELDTYRFNKYLMVPFCDGLNSSFLDKKNNIKEELLNEFLENTVVTLGRHNIRAISFSKVTSVRRFHEDYVMRKFIPKMANNIFKLSSSLKIEHVKKIAVAEGEEIKSKLANILDILQCKKEFIDQLNVDARGFIEVSKTSVSSIITKLESIDELFDF